MLRKLLCFIPFCIFLASCATPTPYKPEGPQGGFTDMALNKDTYIVTFRGNTVTSPELVNSYLLRRGAELTLNNGYNYFVKLDGETAKNTAVVQVPTTINKTKDKDTKTTTTVINEGGSYTVDSYTSRMTIKMFANNAKHPNALNAATILGNFREPKKA